MDLHMECAFLLEGRVGRVEGDGGVANFRDKGRQIRIETVAAEHLRVHRHLDQREIVHALIETGMFGNFYLRSFRIIPQDVLGSPRESDPFCVVSNKQVVA